MRTLSADQSDWVRKLTWTITFANACFQFSTYMYYNVPLMRTQMHQNARVCNDTTHLKDHVGKRQSSKDEFKYKLVATTSYKIAEGMDPERFFHIISQENWRAKDEERKSMTKTPSCLYTKINSHFISASYNFSTLVEQYMQQSFGAVLL